MPTVSSLVAAMSIEELRSLSQVPTSISLELLVGAAVPIIGGADKAVYFT